MLQEMSRPARILQETSESEEMSDLPESLSEYTCKILADRVLYVPLLQDSCKKCMGVRLE